MSNGTAEHEDLELLAAHFVLGLLETAEREAFEVRLAREPELRRALAMARERFLELDTVAPVAEAGEALWSRIEAATKVTPAKVSDLDAARNMRRSAAPVRRTSLSGGGFWRGFAAASVAALMVGAAGYATLKPAQPRLVVVLLNEKAEPVSIVEAYAGQRIRVVPLGAIPVPEGKTLQVWTLQDRNTGPVSIGLMPRSGTTTLEGPALPPAQPDQLYEITVEPAGGSPTGKPTGPIVGKGFARIPQI